MPASVDPLESIDADGSEPSDVGLAERNLPLPEDIRALQARLEPHLPRLFRVCLVLERNRDDAEELLQDAMLRAWLHRRDYQGTGSLFGWLYRIMQHQYLDRVRRLARRRSLWQRSADAALEVWDAVVPAGDPQELVERFADEQELLQCLHEVPEPFRTVLLLCDLEEMDYAAASAVLKQPLGTVKSRHARGRAKLRAALLARRQSVSTGDAKEAR